MLLWTGQQGALVARARSYSAQGAMAYAPVADLLRTPVLYAGLSQLNEQWLTPLVRILPELLDDHPYLSPPESMVESWQRHQFQEALVRAAVAHGQPLLLLLDDLQWCDAETLAWVERLLRSEAAQHLLIVGAVRNDEVDTTHPLVELQMSLRRDELVSEVALQPLNAEETVHLARQVTDSTLDRAQMAQLFADTEGNPLFVVETVRAQEKQQTETEDRAAQTGLPPKVHTVIKLRLAQLSLDAQRIANLAAVMGRSFTFALLRAASPADEDELLDSLDQLLQRHIVREQSAEMYDFTHDRIRDVAYAELSRARRRVLHRRVAHAVEIVFVNQLDGVFGVLADHYTRAGNQEKAWHYLCEAGEEASRRFANLEAARFFHNALALLADLFEMSERMPRELRLQLALAEVQSRAGHFADAMQIFEQAAQLAIQLESGEELARAAVGFEDARYRFNLPPETAVRLLNQASQALGTDDSILKVRVLGYLGQALVFLGAQEEAEQYAEEAIAMARRVGDPVALFDVLRISNLHHRRPERIAGRVAAADEMLQLAQQIGGEDKSVQAYPAFIVERTAIGDTEAVNMALETGIQVAKKFQQPFWLYAIQSQQAMQAMVAGAFDEAERLALVAMQTGQQMEIENVDGLYGIQMFTIRREQQGLRAFAPIVESFVARNPESSTWLPGLALIYTDLEQEANARAIFERLAVSNFGELARDALWVSSLAYLSEVCAFLGDDARAAKLYQYLLPYAEQTILIGMASVCLGSASRFLGILATIMERWETAENHFKDALEMNTNMGAIPWLAHTQHAYAIMLLSRGEANDRAHAVSLLDEAYQSAQGLGMMFISEKIVALRESQIVQDQ